MSKRNRLQIANGKLQILDCCIAAALVVVMMSLTGCARHRDQSGESEAAAQNLPVVASQSGGEMVLIPAGSFLMGDNSGRPDETPHMAVEPVDPSEEDESGPEGG